MKYQYDIIQISTVDGCRNELGTIHMNALQQRFAGLWLIVGIGVGTGVGVATGFGSIGLALGTVSGIVAGALVGHRRR
jgi:hypothetical protein